MTMSTDGALLVKCAGPAPDAGALATDLSALASGCGAPMARVAAHAALSDGELYAYLFSPALERLTDAAAARVADAARRLATLSGRTIETVCLRPIVDCPGASKGQPAPFHYIVETDVVPEHEADLNAWYESEHLPGLASVPGSVRARRFRNLSAGPRYFAAYDLVSPDVLASEPWLAVRHTAWSDRVRPHFRNTKRTMFRRLFELTPA